MIRLRAILEKRDLNHSKFENQQRPDIGSKKTVNRELKSPKMDDSRKTPENENTNPKLWDIKKYLFLNR